MAQVTYPELDGNVTISRDLLQFTATTSVSPPKILKEIEEIKAENPDLYEALAEENEDLIRQNYSP